jgi:hypothetical protein
MWALVAGGLELELVESADRLVVSECDPALVLVESVMWASVAVGLELELVG